MNLFTSLLILGNIGRLGWWEVGGCEGTQHAYLNETGLLWVSGKILVIRAAGDALNAQRFWFVYECLWTCAFVCGPIHHILYLNLLCPHQACVALVCRYCSIKTVVFFKTIMAYPLFILV